MFESIANDMRWHHERKRPEGNILIHASNGLVWKEFDKNHKWFARDCRNVQLGLCSDGFHPFANMSQSHSTWPLFLVPYNLPPWKCMRDEFFMMSMIIPGPRAPGNDIDVYLQLLIEDLNDLWYNGVPTYDASRFEMFMLHVALMWTINDFPAYGNLSG